jgi:hypothetical protein
MAAFDLAAASYRQAATSRQPETGLERRAQDSVENEP